MTSRSGFDRPLNRGTSIGNPVVVEQPENVSQQAVCIRPLVGRLLHHITSTEGSSIRNPVTLEQPENISHKAATSSSICAILIGDIYVGTTGECSSQISILASTKRGSIQNAALLGQSDPRTHLARFICFAIRVSWLSKIFTFLIAPYGKPDMLNPKSGNGGAIGERLQAL